MADYYVNAPVQTIILVAAITAAAWLLTWVIDRAITRRTTPTPPDAGLSILDPASDIMAIADAVDDRCPETWIDETGCDHHCTRPDGHGTTGHTCRCGSLILDLPPVEHDPVAIRLGITPNPDGDSAMVPYGVSTVHRGCLTARTNAATDHICTRCGQVFGRQVTR